MSDMRTSISAKGVYVNGEVCSGTMVCVWCAVKMCQ